MILVASLLQFEQGSAYLAKVEGKGMKGIKGSKSGT